MWLHTTCCGHIQHRQLSPRAQPNPIATCPHAAEFAADGPCTDEYLLAGDELTTNEAGVSSISFADFAVAMLDEAERTGSDAHVRERISVLGK